jgi:transcriptional regulator with XRE-family HTH domain
MRMRGLLASDVARAMGISPEHFSNLRRGRAGIESYAERWADVLGVDLDGEEVMDAVLEDFTRLLKQRLSDPATDTQAKVLWLDELSRSLEKRVPVRVANLYFDFLDDISPDQSKHLYVAGEPGDFPPYGVNRARRKHHRP